MTLNCIDFRTLIPALHQLQLVLAKQKTEAKTLESMATTSTIQRSAFGGDTILKPPNQLLCKVAVNGGRVSVHRTTKTASHSLCHKKCRSQGKILAQSCISSILTSEMGFCRRDLMLFGLSASLALVFPKSGIGAEEEIKMADFVDDINAYAYRYPTELPSKRLMFKWVESRKPERYSSAAPLSPDARLRIVSERVDFIDNVVISVSVGPPHVEFLKSKDKSTWNAKDVADSVLSDKSALRVSSTQRLAESSILDAHSSEIDGERYWVYEYLVRKSPTKSVQEPTNYRQYVASTAERDGFLYTLNASTLSKQWDLMGPILKRTVDSFRLLPPTENYVPPYKDPWRFW